MLKEEFLVERLSARESFDLGSAARANAEALALCTT
jgi:hypothetical protein